jgi:hypothetical protein
MPQYLLAIYHDGRAKSEAEFQRSYEDVNALADELAAAGGLVFGGGFTPSTPTVFRSVDGQIVITDGPFAETKEQLGGFWIIEVDDLDAAHDWAAKLTVAVGRPIEVRTFEDDEATTEELFEHAIEEGLGSRG